MIEENYVTPEVHSCHSSYVFIGFIFIAFTINMLKCDLLIVGQFIMGLTFYFPVMAVIAFAYRVQKDGESECVTVGGVAGAEGGRTGIVIPEVVDVVVGLEKEIVKFIHCLYQEVISI
ncbi:MAG TPA: hypothetical protein EYP30_02660 [Archaeoglobaceae archaeon]|nr:hypothetical protein [Archaeoglobaceae archaeon]